MIMDQRARTGEAQPSPSGKIAELGSTADLLSLLWAGGQAGDHAVTPRPGPAAPRGPRATAEYIGYFVGTLTGILVPALIRSPRKE